MEVQEILSCPNNKSAIGQVKVIPSESIGEPLSALPFNREDVLATNKTLTDKVSINK